MGVDDGDEISSLVLVLVWELGEPIQRVVGKEDEEPRLKVHEDHRPELKSPYPSTCKVCCY